MVSPAHQPQRLLVLGGCAVLQPERAVRLQVLAEAGRLNGCEAVVGVVQQRYLRAELRPYRLEHRGGVPQVGVGVPVLDQGPGLLVEDARALFIGGVHPVDGLEAGNARLDADGGVALGQPRPYGVEEFGDVAPIGVAVGGEAVTGGAAEQLVERQARGLRLDVPQRDVHRGDGGHRDRAAPPVGAPVEVLPGVLDPVRVQADEQGPHGR